MKNTDKKNRLVFGENYDSGGAGIITSVDDYGKFAADLSLGDVGLNGERILSSSTVRLMHTTLMYLSVYLKSENQNTFIGKMLFGVNQILRK